MFFTQDRKLIQSSKIKISYERGLKMNSGMKQDFKVDYRWFDAAVLTLTWTVYIYEIPNSSLTVKQSVKKQKQFSQF